MTDSHPGRRECAGEEALTQLLLEIHGLHPDEVPAAVARAAAMFGATDVVIYLVDLNQRDLVPFGTATGTGDDEILSVDGTLAGRAFRTEEALVGDPRAQVGADGPDPSAEAGGDGTPPTASATARRLLVPILDAAERLGVLALTVEDLDDTTRRRAEALASLVGEVVMSKGAYGDGIQACRRRQEMDLAAEMRWSLLPPLTFSSPRIVISAILEPAYNIAGDAFDYAVNGDKAHVAIVDAMGHGLEASRIANVAVGAYRNGRRRGLTFVESFKWMDEVVSTAFGGDRFVTGQLAELDLASGRLDWLNAGHPRPLLLRNGRDVSQLACEPCLPIGLGDVSTETSSISLEPNDSVLFFTDGVTEARSPKGVPFGRTRLADMLVRAAASRERPAEILRRLSHAILEHQQQRLDDDASILLLHWLGG